jgi:phage gpG-like protein
MMRYRYTGKPWHKVLDDLNRAIAAELPDTAKRHAVAHFNNSFREQGFTDRALVKWPARSGNKDTGRALLIKSGRLRRSIQGRTEPGRVIIESLDVPYAEIHNKGGRVSLTQRVKEHSRRRKGNTHTVSAHSRRMNYTMPQRQFMGESYVLYSRIEKEISTAIKKAFR